MNRIKTFLSLVTPFFYGNEKRYARRAGLVLLILSQASTTYGYFFIQWNRRFYDALEMKNADAFLQECIIFIILCVFYFLTYSLTRYWGQKYALRWRIWMTTSALTTWTVNPQRGSLEGSDQRIQEDLMRFATIFERLFLESFNALLLVLLFIPLLFIETKALSLFSLPLGLVLALTVVIYTLFGMTVSAKIANPLIDLEYNNQKLEAEFRYNLVHIRDGKEVPSTFFDALLINIRNNYHQIFNRQKYFNLWQKGYDQISFLLPFMLVGPFYFSGALTFGMIMQIKSTFSRVRNSMAYLLDHYTELTEMLAIAKRLVEFYNSAAIDLKEKPIKSSNILNPALY